MCDQWFGHTCPCEQLPALRQWMLWWARRPGCVAGLIVRGFPSVPYERKFLAWTGLRLSSAEQFEEFSRGDTSLPQD